MLWDTKADVSRSIVKSGDQTPGKNRASLLSQGTNDRNNVLYIKCFWGIAAEFTKYAVSYGFGEIKLPEISAVVRANHMSSQKVLTNAGLRYVSDIHDVKNAPVSMLFTLTQNEWGKKSE